jgi:hypothetical protein
MEEERLKELIPNVDEYEDDRGNPVYYPKDVQKQTEDLRKAVKVLCQVVDGFENGGNQDCIGTVGFLKDIIEDLTGIKYEEIEG